MGIDYNANLGYGFKLTDECIVDKINEGVLDIGKGFEIVWSGDAYAGKMYTFLCIRESVQSTWSGDGQTSPIKPEKLAVQQGWDSKLLNWCKENGVTKPKIGWWLCSSVS